MVKIHPKQNIICDFENLAKFFQKKKQKLVEFTLSKKIPIFQINEIDSRKKR
jgi:hypothetical protein